jgi:3-methyladenine DNA glycosylase AlkD
MDRAHPRDELVRELRRLAHPTPGFDLQAYLGSPLPTLGVAIPDLRRLARSSAQTLRSWPSGARRTLLRSLWNGATVEERLLAIELLDALPELSDEATWRMVDRWVDDATGWCLTDSIGSTPVSALLVDHPRRFAEVLRWTRSPNLWRRRVALYAMRRDVRARTLDRPFEVIDRLLHDPEFFVQRAVGTWLRECWKVDRTRTERYLRARSSSLPRVVITVATERSPDRFRAELRSLNGYGPTPRSRGPEAPT